MEHRRVCFCMLSLLPLVQISKLSQANSLLFGKVCCRTPRGVRGLKFEHWHQNTTTIQGRTPRGVRGLKYTVNKISKKIHLSHPSRGAWIEIPPYSRVNPIITSRTPRGVRGLKCKEIMKKRKEEFVAPLAGCVD